jgi:hypothetical protein
MWAEIKSSLIGRLNVQIGRIYPQSSNYRAPLGNQNKGGSTISLTRKLFSFGCLNLLPAALYFLKSASPKRDTDATLVKRKFSLVTIVHLLVGSKISQPFEFSSIKCYICLPHPAYNQLQTHSPTPTLFMMSS